MELRDLPSVDELARDDRRPGQPAALAVEAARTALARAREAIGAGHDPGDLGERAAEELASARAPSLRRTLNATGVIVHTNLGRAPLAEPAALAVEAARTALARAREAIRAGHDPGDLGERAAEELASARAPSLRRTLNATGVIVHTKLGRAPLAEAPLERALEVGRSYSNLEYELTAGTRGSRQDHAASILRRLTGAEAALVGNNNAAAVMLALAALAEGREGVLSPGQP